jgi:hypothetical protein
VEVIKELVAVLTPLEKMTSHFSGSQYVTLSWVYPMVINCLRELADFKPLSRVAQNAKATIEIELRDRWDKIVCDAARVGMMLDPRFKSMTLTGDPDVEPNFTRLRTLFEGERQLMPQDVGRAPKPESNDGSHGFFHPSLRAAVPLQDEFFLYRSEPEIPIFVSDPKNPSELIPNDPLAWWASNQQRFPTFASLARKYLAIPASSVPSESMFSTAGRIATPLRSGISDSAVNACLLIHRNWQFVMSVAPEHYQPKNVPAQVATVFCCVH